VNPLRAIIDRQPALVALREALAAEIGTPNSTVATQENLNALTITLARSYSFVCKGDERYQTLSPAIDRLWVGGEKLVCAEASAAATVTSNQALSDAGRNSAAIDVAGFLHDTLKIPAGTVPSSIIKTTAPGDVARIQPFDYYGAITAELLAARWARPNVRRPQAYLRTTLFREARRHYLRGLSDQRRFDPIEVIMPTATAEANLPDRIMVAADLERGLAVLRAAGMQEDLARLIVERYLRHQRPGDIGVDQEAALELGWTAKRLERVQAALRRDWGTQVQRWFLNGGYRPRKKSLDRVGSEGENLPLVSRGENQ
jgi:hypothetical protein